MQHALSILAWMLRRSAVLPLGCILLLACGTAVSSPPVASVSPMSIPVPPATERPTRPAEQPAPSPTAPTTPPTAVPSAGGALSERGVRIRADSALLVDGQPFFPFGFGLYPQYNSEEFRPETLRSIAASGFNTLLAPIRLNYPDLQADAARLGMRLIAEIYPYELDDAGIVRAIRHVKDGPALLAYSIADDVDDGEYYTPELVSRINQLVKSVDRQHPTYISGFVPQRIHLFMQSADTVAMQSYPIGKTYWEHARIGHVNYALATAIAAARPFNRPIIANLQAFAWPEQREPTAVEIRNMTYQALVNNVRGIIYYTYNDGYWRLEKHPAVLGALRELAPEVQRLTPILLDGLYTPLPTGKPDLLAAQWRYGDEVYVMVVNATDRASAVTVNLATPVSGPAKPVFDRRPGGMTFNAGRLQGSLEAMAVHVYVFKAAR
ncbi:MAG: hypothetical protein RMK84_03830 [Oscillochloridaceae bacterium]|nr:hypothetical protein [Chloroflexaceae bacterium]MDW8389236.1 hypothetical protein [Oscillochloridaceae bacterium]